MAIIGERPVRQAGSRTEIIYIYSPANVHAVFSIHTVQFCTRLFSVSLRRPHSLVVFCFFSSDFWSVKIFWRMWPTLEQQFSSKKRKKKEVRARGGHASCRAGVHFFRASLFLRTAWTFGLSCVKLNQVRYFLQKNLVLVRYQAFSLDRYNMLNF